MTLNSKEGKEILLKRKHEMEKRKGKRKIALFKTEDTGALKIYPPRRPHS